MSKQAEWQVIASPRYLLHSDELQRALTKLVKSARAKNTDAAALAYVEMTLTCVRCLEPASHRFPSHPVQPHQKHPRRDLVGRLIVERR